MATKKQQQQQRSFEPLPFKGFVNYNLTDNEKQHLKEMGVDHDRLWDTAESLMESAWSFKFRYDYYNHAYQVVVSQTDPKNPDVGWLLTGRGSTPMKALRQALYILEQIDCKLSEYMANQKQAIDEIDD